MAKKILIPIDFRVESLNTLKFALAEQADPVEVVLLYSRILSDSITDLLFYSAQKEIAELTSKEFEQALEIIANRFGKTLATIRVEFLNGNNLSLLKNILQNLRTESIYIPKNYKLVIGKRGFDPLPLLRRSALPIQEVDWVVQNQPAEKDQLHTLFNWIKPAHDIK